ncbi:MAG: hypothetical protein PWP23_2811 [Candidatus Sumerlaeota bacterium]|nr:hypothetical protein [Candidatus Sumerlaeota bacterium]
MQRRPAFLSRESVLCASALRLTLGYAVFSILWIIFSDNIVAALVEDTNWRTAVESAKGVGFVIVTSLLGYAILTREFHARQREVRSARRLAAIIEGSHDAVLIVDRSGSIVMWNASAERLYGWKAAEAYRMRFIELVVPDLRKVARERMAAIFDGQEITSYESKRRTKNGRVLDVWVTVTPLKRRGKQARLVALTERDITELRRVEIELRRLNEELEERVRVRTEQLEVSNRELEAFAYTISHDLRAPVRAVRSYTNAIAEELDGEVSDEVAEYLGRLQASAERMRERIDGLLQLSRLTRREIEWEEVDLSRMARCIVAELTAADPERTVYTHIESGIVVRGDRVLLRTLMEMLIGNAWKFTAGRAEAEIHVETCAAADGRKAVCVRDNGAGFDMNYADKLFVPFQRLHAESVFPGTGIGLATAAGIVTQHGGRIWAEGKPDKGAAFTFLLGERSALEPITAAVQASHSTRPEGTTDK